MINKLRYLSGLSSKDDKPLFIVRRDLSGGQNTRQHASHIGENQAVVLQNVDISIPGERSKRLGSVLIANDKGSDTVVALYTYERQGYTDNLMMVEDTHLWANETEASTWTAVKANFTANEDVGIISVKESGLVPDDVIMVSISGNNWFRFQKDSASAWQTQDLGSTAGTGSDSPPASTVGNWYGNRFWVLKDDLLYFSDAYSVDYSSAFDTVSNVFRVPVGTERALVSTRDLGIVIFGEKEVWALAPSATPVVTDKPQPIITSLGCVSKKGVVAAGDDIYFFAQDGLRALIRTVQDKLQLGADYPISYALKDEYDEIDWSRIDELSMQYFDNKIFIAVPIKEGATETFKTWIYNPATKSFTFIDGWEPRCWAKYKVSGEERLYYGHDDDGTVYRAWYGYTDEGTSTTNGTAVTYQEEGREEDFGQPLILKYGGELELEVAAVGSNCSITVYAKIDNENYVELGTMSLQSDTAPTLPVDLPFTLTDEYILRKKFHLDSLGSFRTIQIKLVNDDKNTEVVKIYGYSITTFPEEYENE